MLIKPQHLPTHKIHKGRMLQIALALFTHWIWPSPGGGCENQQMYLDTTDFRIQRMMIKMNAGEITASQDFMLTPNWSPPVNWNSPGQ